MRYILPGSESPGSAGHATGHRARARGAQDRWSNAGPRIRAPVPRDRGSPGVLGPKRESPGTVGRQRGPSDLGWSLPGNLFETAVPPTQPRVPRDSWSTARALEPGPESPRTAGQHHGSSDTGPSHAGQLVDTAGHRALARVAQDRGSTPLALRAERDSPGRAGRTRGPSDTGPSGLGKPVKTRTIRPGPETHGTAGRSAGPRT